MSSAGLIYPDAPELDHIVHLVSPGKLLDSVTQFKNLGFSVERGGVHADGLTQNALIVLTDGVYIELIEFLDKPLPDRTGQPEGETLQQWKERRSKHWWWGRKPGWIDWCLRGGVQDGRAEAVNAASREMETARTSQMVNQKEKTGLGESFQLAGKEEVLYPVAADRKGQSSRAANKTTLAEKLVGASGAGISNTSLPNTNGESPRTSSSLPTFVRYQGSQGGGRRAFSGKHIQWKVTFPDPETGIQRGTFPFWCEDISPRWWRVPTPSPPHPNLTRGLSALTLLYFPETFPTRLASLQLILASKQAAQNGLAEIAHTIVDTRPPPKTEGKTALPDSFVELYLSTPEGPLLPIRIKAADDPAEVNWLHEYGEGLFEVEISVAAEKLPPSAPPDGIERETERLGYGRLRLHPMQVPPPSYPPPPQPPPPPPVAEESENS